MRRWAWTWTVADMGRHDTGVGVGMQVGVDGGMWHANWTRRYRNLADQSAQVASAVRLDDGAGDDGCAETWGGGILTAGV